MTRATLSIPPKESNNAVTTNLIFLLCVINLRGLKVLNNLSTLTKERLTLSKARSINDENTIKKSKTFHPSLK